MSGNVKEWCLNGATTGHLTTGGSWEDPPYMFARYGVFAVFYSSSALGFRCVRLAAEAAGNQGAMKIDVEKRTPSYSPVNAATFKSFLSFYQYDEKPLNPQLLETRDAPDWIRQKITFAGMHQQPIVAYLFLPRRVARPYQCLHFLPHAGVFSGISVAEAAESILAPQIKAGRAVLAMTPIGARERESEPGYELWPKKNSVKYREQAVQHVTECRLGLDYLQTRDDIDFEKLALVGASWGATEATLILAAIESRYRAAVFIASGIKPFDPQKLPEANPINFAPHIKPPKLMVHGKYDEFFPYETQALPLYNLLRQPKQLQVIEGGHTPSLELRTPIINKWLDEIFGPVRREGRGVRSEG
jgi:dienelactone hydrolase